jgi:single-strand DNA-binding protein
MALPIVNAEFWVGTEPELTFDAEGTAKLRFRLKAQDRTYNRETKEWVNGKELWVNATVWRKMAENVADSIRKGDNVVASGKLSTRAWEDKTKAKRESLDFEVLEIGTSLRFRSTPHGAASGGSDSRAQAGQGTGTRETASATQGGVQGSDPEPAW